MTQISYTLNREPDEISILVDYTYTPGWPGTRMDPPDEPEIDIINTRMLDGTKVELTDDEAERLWNHIAEEHWDD